MEQNRCDRWIEDYRATHDTFATCVDATKEMLIAFPELLRVRGDVFLSNGWLRHHWWLKEKSGEIHDPTANQFEGDYYGNARILEYLEHDETLPEPTGKCPNCGDGYCYNGDSVCCEECGIQYTSYLNGFC
jgi:hypothetical protein